MLDPHSPEASTDPLAKPTAKQLRYLRVLADLTGTTFTPPTTREDASEQIDELKSRPRTSRADRARDSATVERDLDQAPRDAVRHRPGETTGYGSNAHWANDRARGQR